MHRIFISFILLFFSNTPSFAETLWNAQISPYQRPKFLILVDGYQNCCASGMQSLIHRAEQLNFTVHRAYWNSFNMPPFAEDINPNGTNAFVNTAIEFIHRRVPPDSDIYIVGHSFGGDSILQLFDRYANTRVNWRLVAVLDPVGYGGFRSSALRFSVPNYVTYFYNRWQTNRPLPFDYELGGGIACNANYCDDQKPHNKKRTRNGKTYYRTCDITEVTCPGYQPAPMGRRCIKVPTTRMEERCMDVPGTEQRCKFGICGPVPVMKNVCRDVPVTYMRDKCSQVPVGVARPGRAQIRTDHVYMPIDAFIQQNLIDIIESLNRGR